MMINPKLQHFMAKRIGANTISLNASHASAVSHPREVADLIMDAANLAADAANLAAMKVGAA